MIQEAAGPFSRPFPLHRVTPNGIDTSLEADPQERALLARDLGLPAIHSLIARYRVTGQADRIRVVGRLAAKVEQLCVVTLEPFACDVDQEVEVEFATSDPGRRGGPELELDVDEDVPDELVGDSVDLGAVTAEFLALGLDPHPRRPGATFEPPPEKPGASPFAGLAALRVVGPEETGES